MLPDGRDVIALGRHGDHQALAVVEIEHLPAGPGLGGDRLLLGDEAARRAGRQQELAVGTIHGEPERLGAARQIDLQPQRLALAAAARQAIDRQQIAAAVAADQQQLVGGLGLEHEARAVTFLVFELGVVLEMAAQHP